MKHYCNRRIPRDNTPKRYPIPENPEPKEPSDAMINIQENNLKETEDEIVLPPGVGYEMFYDAGILTPPDNLEIAQGGSITQGSGYLKETGQMDNRPRVGDFSHNIPYDNMSGKFNLISVPHNNSSLSMQSMSSFLDRYLGKLICLDLWTADCIREEICGILTETGRNFLVITQPDTEKLTMIDLRSVRYINVYCR